MLGAYMGYGSGLLSMANTLSLYGGVVLFTGFMAYDTQ